MTQFFKKKMSVRAIEVRLKASGGYTLNIYIYIYIYIYNKYRLVWIINTIIICIRIYIICIYAYTIYI